MMKKLIGILFGFVVLAAFAGTLYYLYGKTEEKPIVFETRTPEVTTIVRKTVATGSVVPRKEVEIKPQVSGVVDEIFVESGDTVKSGDLMARIRIIPDMVTLANAENRIDRARINLESADVDLDRRDEVLAISEALLKFDGETTYVAVETGPQQFEQRDVETGLSDGINIEVVSGLSEDERIKDPNSAS